jgi:hypothetical protein
MILPETEILVWVPQCDGWEFQKYGRRFGGRSFS